MMDNLEFQKANWQRIDEEKRKLLVADLKHWIPFNMMKELRDIAKANFDVPGFHFSGGMSIRNRLRMTMTDNQLPVVETYPNGEPYGQQNWDDFYMGAILEVCDDKN